MPPKKKVVKSQSVAASKGKPPGTSKKPAATPTLEDQVIELLTDFYRHMIRDTHHDEGGVNMKRDRPTVFAWTHFNSDDWVEKFLIRRKDGGKFTPKFMTTLQPKLVELVNRIIEANNRFVVATNYHLCPLSKKDIDSLLAVSITNSGLLQVELEYNTELNFDFTNIESSIECYQDDKFIETRGDKSTLDLL
jgi:hypothetical protein